MATQLPLLSACVTRILSLSGFARDLKTKDIQQAFSDWENVQGGFKIKWVDDTSLYIVFADPAIAKRAYLQAIFAPPPIFESPATGKLAKIKPYDGADAQNVIQAVHARSNNNIHNRGHSSRASISVGGGVAGIHARMGSGHNDHRSISSSVPLDHPLPPPPHHHNQGPNHHISIPPQPPGVVREPSPTLPNLPTQPTLNSLISSSLSSSEQLSDTSETNTNPSIGTSSAANVPPRIGDPGKRMVAHSLGVKHPNLARSASGEELHVRVRELAKGMHGVSLTE